MDNLVLLHELQVFMIRFDENVQEEPTGQMVMPQGKKSQKRAFPTIRTDGLEIWWILYIYMYVFNI